VTVAVDELRVSFPRLRERIDALGAIGAIDGGGCARLALTDADREGRDLVGVGNVVGTWPAARAEPPVLVGSHIDTVATGGRYDGNLGVLAGLEVNETLERHAIPTAHPMAVAFFTDEE